MYYPFILGFLSIQSLKPNINTDPATTKPNTAISGRWYPHDSARNKDMAKVPYVVSCKAV